MKHLRQLEDQSVYVLREAYKHFDNLAMLWSMGKDSTVLLWLARKAFFGHVPFPLLHVDTSYKIPAMIEYRDRLAREWHLNLVVGQNKEALAGGMNHTLGRVPKAARRNSVLRRPHRRPGVCRTCPPQPRISSSSTGSFRRRRNIKLRAKLLG